MDSDKAAKALARVMKARASMVLKLPFFGVLSIRLELLPSELNDTGWTDGTYLGFNPDFILGLPSIEEVKFFVAHEVLHCAGGHMWRLKGRDKQKFNIAADYTINGELVEAGFTPIKGMLLDPKYTGHSAEWIYNRLPDSLKGGKGQGNGMPGGGGIDVMEPGTGGKEAQGQQGQVQPNGSTSPPPQQQTESSRVKAGQTRIVMAAWASPPSIGAQHCASSFRSDKRPTTAGAGRTTSSLTWGCICRRSTTRP
jgi:hypothetical protein